jgi:hypothetical protein
LALLTLSLAEMAVYVDREENPFGRRIMCHMLADSLEELHAMADKIGMKRSWYQPKSTPHYDLCQLQRLMAVQAGAIEIDRKRTVQIIREWRARQQHQYTC